MPYNPQMGASKGVKNLLSGLISAGIALILNSGNFIVGNCPDIASTVVVETITIKTAWDLIANYLKHRKCNPLKVILMEVKLHEHKHH